MAACNHMVKHLGVIAAGLAHSGIHLFCIIIILRPHIGKNVDIVMIFYKIGKHFKIKRLKLPLYLIAHKLIIGRDIILPRFFIALGVILLAYTL